MLKTDRMSPREVALASFSCEKKGLGQNHRRPSGAVCRLTSLQNLELDMPESIVLYVLASMNRDQGRK